MGLALEKIIVNKIYYIGYCSHKPGSDWVGSLEFGIISSWWQIGPWSNSSKIIQKSRKEEVGFLFPVWDRWNHNKHSVQKTTPVITKIYNKVWWPSGKDTWLSHRQTGFNPQWYLFEENFFLCLCFTTKLIPESRNLYLSTPMDDFSTSVLESFMAWLDGVTYFEKAVF